MKHFQWLTERRVEKNACFRVAGVKLRLMMHQFGIAGNHRTHATIGENFQQGRMR